MSTPVLVALDIPGGDLAQDQHHQGRLHERLPDLPRGRRPGIRSGAYAALVDEVRQAGVPVRDLERDDGEGRRAVLQAWLERRARVVSSSDMAFNQTPNNTGVSSSDMPLNLTPNNASR